MSDAVESDVLDEAQREAGLQVPVRQLASDKSATQDQSKGAGMSQVLDALAVANAAKAGQLAVRREVASGDLSMAEAINDERAGGLKVGVLIRSVRGWGQLACDDLLGIGGMFISEQRTVRSLSDRQREAIGRRVTPRR